METSFHTTLLLAFCPQVISKSPDFYISLRKFRIKTAAVQEMFAQSDKCLQPDVKSLGASCVDWAPATKGLETLQDEALLPKAGLTWSLL